MRRTEGYDATERNVLLAWIMHLDCSDPWQPRVTGRCQRAAVRSSIVIGGSPPAEVDARPGEDRGQAEMHMTLLLDFGGGECRWWLDGCAMRVGTRTKVLPPQLEKKAAALVRAPIALFHVDHAETQHDRAGLRDDVPIDVCVDTQPGPPPYLEHSRR